MWARKDLQEALQEHKIIKITFPEAKSSLEGKITAIELSGITFEYELLRRKTCARAITATNASCCDHTPTPYVTTCHRSTDKTQTFKQFIKAGVVEKSRVGLNWRHEQPFGFKL